MIVCVFRATQGGGHHIATGLGAAGVWLDFRARQFVGLQPEATDRNRILLSHLQYVHTPDSFFFSSEPA